MRDIVTRTRSNVIDQLNRLSPRERALAALMACLLSIWWAVGSYGVAETSRERLADVRAEHATKARLLEAQNSESFRAALAGDVRNARAWAVSAGTAQIAAIRAQAQLEQLAAESGVGEALVTVRRAPPDDLLVQQVELGIEGAYDALSFNSLLSAMAGAEQSLTPVSIEVEGPDNRFRMRVVALYVAPERGT